MSSIKAENAVHSNERDKHIMVNILYMCIYNPGVQSDISNIGDWTHDVKFISWKTKKQIRSIMFKTNKQK